MNKLKFIYRNLFYTSKLSEILTWSLDLTIVEPCMWCSEQVSPAMFVFLTQQPIVIIYMMLDEFSPIIFKWYMSEQKVIVMDSLSFGVWRPFNIRYQIYYQS